MKVKNYFIIVLTVMVVGTEGWMLGLIFQDHLSSFLKEGEYNIVKSIYRNFPDQTEGWVWRWYITKNRGFWLRQVDQELLNTAQKLTDKQDDCFRQMTRQLVDLVSGNHDPRLTLAKTAYQCGHEQVDELALASWLAPEWSYFWIEWANWERMQGNHENAISILDWCQKHPEPKHHCMVIKQEFLANNEGIYQVGNWQRDIESLK